MELEFRKDFEEVQKRWDSFWEGTNNRPLVWMISPKKGVKTRPKPHLYRCTFGNYNEVIDEALAWGASHDFLCDTIPFFPVSFAADHFSALLGAELKAHPDSPNTIWPVPFIKDLDEAEICFRKDGEWWQRTLEVIRAFRQRCDGKLIISACHLQGGLDCLCALRGTNELLMDLVMAPDKVKKVLRDIDKALYEVREAVDEELGMQKYGSLTRHGMYSRGSIDVPQCDFSAMISPQMFEEFAMPSLRNQCEQLEVAEYHLDGPDAIKHLEVVCSIDKVKIIQWVAGAGNAVLQDWTDLYKHIDSLGKGQVMGASKERMIAMWQDFQSSQLFFHAEVHDTPEEAQRFMDEQKAISLNPDLALGGVTYGWLKASLESIDILMGTGYPEAIRTPVLIVAADCDRVVSVKAQEQICDRLPDGRIRIVPQSRHEVLKETNQVRSLFWQEFDRFILA